MATEQTPLFFIMDPIQSLPSYNFKDLGVILKSLLRYVYCPFCSNHNRSSKPSLCLSLCLTFVFFQLLMNRLQFATLGMTCFAPFSKMLKNTIPFQYVHRNFFIFHIKLNSELVYLLSYNSLNLVISFYIIFSPLIFLQFLQQNYFSLIYQ